LCGPESPKQKSRQKIDCFALIIELGIVVAANFSAPKICKNEEDNPKKFLQNRGIKIRIELQLIRISLNMVNRILENEFRVPIPKIFKFAS